MSLRERIQSPRIWKPIFLVFLAGLGVLSAYGLVVHLGGGTGGLADPNESASGLVADGCVLIWIVAFLITLAVAVRRLPEPVAASFWRQNRFFLLGWAALFLSVILIHACQLIAPVSLPIAWHMETAALILGALGAALMLLAAWRREAWWQRK